MAPRVGLESRLWRDFGRRPQPIPPVAGLKATMILEEPRNASFFDPALQEHGLRSGFNRCRPHQRPRPFEALGGFGQVVGGVVVLFESCIQLVRLAAVETAGGLAFKDVDPTWHNKSPAGNPAGLGVFGSPSRT